MPGEISQNAEPQKRRWFPLWKLDCYILREFLIKYSILLLVFIILFMLGDVYRDISEFLDSGISWKIILLYLLCRLPGNILFILPITMLLGCMWTMAAFGKNMEITAMRASGVSLFRCSGSILLMGILVTGVNIFFNEEFVPRTSREAERILTEIAEQQRYVQAFLVFRSPDHKRQWLFQEFVRGDRQRDVWLKTVWTEPLADQVIFSRGEEEQRKIIAAVFADRSEKYTAMPHDEMVRRVKKELEGRRVDIFGGQTEYDKKSGIWKFSEGYFISYDRNDETMYTASQGISRLHAEIPFDTLSVDQKVVPERPDDILNSVREKNDLPTWVIWSLVRRSPYMADKVKAIYMTVFYYRLAFPWACFLAVFLGIPLATKNERTGSMMAIITAIALIVGYIVVAQIFMVLGKAGILPAAVAGLAPTLVFIASGALRIYYDRN